MNRQSHINPETLLPFPLVNLREPIPKNKPLGHSFQPGPHDVICGRGKSVFWHDGNQEFRRYIDENADRYRRARSKLDKSLIVIEIVDCIRSNSPNGGFVKQIKPRGEASILDGPHWVEVGDALAREKTGHALRDAVNGKSYPSHPPEAYRYMGTTKGEYLKPKRPTPLGCTGPSELLDSAADVGNLQSMLAVTSAEQRHDATESLDDFNTLDCDTLNIDMSFDPYSFVGDT